MPDKLNAIIAHYRRLDGNANFGKMKLYGMIADDLSAIIGDEISWTWKYLRNVELGHVEVGKLLGKAINIMHSMVTDSPLPHARSKREPKLEIHKRKEKVSAAADSIIENLGIVYAQLLINQLNDKISKKIRELEENETPQENQS